MSAKTKMAKLVCALAMVASFATISGAAQAETTGWLWYDSVFLAPPPVAPPARTRAVRRAKPIQVSAAVPSTRPVLVSAATIAQNESCFWCNRRVYISGLSF